MERSHRLSRGGLVAILCAALVLGGCQASGKPRTVVQVSAKEQAKVRPAPFRGEYRLYAATAKSGGWVTAAGEPIATHRLDQRQPIGFRRDNRALAAVAGDASIALQPGPYLWQMRADPGQFDKEKTVALVLGIAAVTGIALGAVAVAMAPF